MPALARALALPLRPEQVVALPLTDVSPEMGPTEMCPGKKLRFYRGYRCQDHLRMATTEGTIAIFDYKTLHRGPGNAHATLERAMVSMVPSAPDPPQTCPSHPRPLPSARPTRPTPAHPTPPRPGPPQPAPAQPSPPQHRTTPHTTPRLVA